MLTLAEKDTTIIATKKLLRETGKPGIEDLLKYLEEDGFYSIPASVKHHCNYQGGLLEHSWNVFTEFSRLVSTLELVIDSSSIVVTSLLHDLCKMGAYKKSSNGYHWNKEQPKGHGSLSVLRLKKFVELSEEEEALITYHMGPWHTVQMLGTDKGEYTILQLKKAWVNFPTTRFLYFADEIATQLEKNKEEENEQSS